MLQECNSSTKYFPSSQDFRLLLGFSGAPCPFWQPGTLELPREVVCFLDTCALRELSENAFCGTAALILTVDETSPEVTVAA